MLPRATARRLAAPVASPLRRRAIGWRTQSWPPYSRLFVAGDGHAWAIGDDAAQIARVARNLGVRVGAESWISGVRGQAIFHASQFTLIGQEFDAAGNRLGVAYLHGRPGTPGMPEFDTCYETVRRRHHELERIQVSSRAMEELVLGAGVPREKVFRIPIGVDLDRFPPRTDAGRAEARRCFGVPEGVFLAGSFQKDGVGWQEGLEPKLIKGPDVFLDTLARVRNSVSDLWVLLTGPARGYVRQGLAKLGIPHRHAFLEDPEDVARAYAALDVYLVASREEGGPKAVLESMATGVPLVTTRVGQAADLVRDGENGYLVDVDDVEALAQRAVDVATAPAADVVRITRAGRTTAESSSYAALAPRWRELLSGFVALEDA